MSQGVTMRICNLADSTTQSEVEDFFRGDLRNSRDFSLPDVVRVTLMLDENRQSKGFVFIKFATKEVAEKARKRNGQPLHGNRVILTEDEEKHVTMPFKEGHVIAVTNFSVNDDVKKLRDKLKKRFQTCGPIKELFMPVALNMYLKEPKTGTAYIDFEHEDGQSRALNKTKALPLEGDTRRLEIVIPKFRNFSFLRQTGGGHGGVFGYKYGGNFEVDSRLMKSLKYATQMQKLTTSAEKLLSCKRHGFLPKAWDFSVHPKVINLAGHPWNVSTSGNRKRKRQKTNSGTSGGKRMRHN